MTCVAAAVVLVVVLGAAAVAAVVDVVQVDERYAHAVTYLGQMSLSKTYLLPMLEEVAPLGLAIYGYGKTRTWPTCMCSLVS